MAVMSGNARVLGSPCIQPTASLVHLEGFPHRQRGRGKYCRNPPHSFSMSGLAIFGTVGTVLDIVGRSINAVCTLRDLHHDLRPNPAQCNRVCESLRKLRAYLEEKACLQEMQAACLGNFWFDALGEVRAVLLDPGAHEA